MVPASNPRLVVLVMVDEPRGSIFGGVVAAPAFAAIAKFDLQYLEVPPDAPEDPEHVARMEIAALGPEHWDAVARIYAEGIATGNATFETEVPPREAWDEAYLPDHARLVAFDGGEVGGWEAMSPVSGRCVYAGVVESSVFIAECGTR